MFKNVLFMKRMFTGLAKYGAILNSHFLKMVFKTLRPTASNYAMSLNFNLQACQQVNAPSRSYGFLLLKFALYIERENLII